MSFVKEKLNVRLLTITADPVAIAAEAAKVTNTDKDLMQIFEELLASEDQGGALVERVLSYGHESIAEHCSATFLVEHVSRVCEVEQVRHRIASYSIRAGKVTGGYIRIILPPSLKGLYDNDLEFREVLLQYHDTLLELKGMMDDRGIDRREQRYLFPQGTETAFMLTMNFREINNYFTQRMCETAQWEIKELAWDMYRILLEDRKLSPFFKDSGPECYRGECRQNNACMRS